MTAMAVRHMHIAHAGVPVKYKQHTIHHKDAHLYVKPKQCFALKFSL